MRKSDEEILSAIAEKDSAAVAELYDRYSRLIYGALLRMLRSTDDAEDVLQEVFVQVWLKAGTYKPDLGAPKFWLVRIAHNRAINLIRSKRAKMKQTEIPIPDTDSPAAAELVAADLFAETSNAEESAYTVRAMNKLPKDQAQLLDMAFFQGYSHSEISEKTNLPLGTVKTRIRNGLLALRESLEFLNENKT
ncbi:MAG TPA: sigma-70 family RNA polymerase sigma factor [Candidatus Kapabacteria bacterium]|nr:sigma-70 family RNA polymerase sigma factor [Candidatus Kapabacteria bacterium]